MAEIGLVRLARLGLDVSPAVLPSQWTEFSKRQFTQPQLMAVLCLMRYEDWTFRGAEVRLNEHTKLRSALQLNSVRDYTSLYRFLAWLRQDDVARVLQFDVDGKYFCGSDMVIKFSPEGQVLMVFGRKQESSDEGTGPIKHLKPPLPPIDGEFRQVTDMAWDAAGNTYISDGYINSRIAKIDKDGNWIKSWGEPGTGPGQFNTPHSIATDDAGNVYVADRGNGRIQVFNGEGKFLREIHINVPYDHKIRPWMGNAPSEVPATAEAPAPLNKTMLNGSPWAICITPGPHQVLYASDGYPGRIYKLTLDGKVLGVLGATGHGPGQFGWIHELACPSENVLYAAELLNWRVQKLTLEPTR